MYFPITLPLETAWSGTRAVILIRVFDRSPTSTSGPRAEIFNVFPEEFLFLEEAFVLEVLFEVFFFSSPSDDFLGAEAFGAAFTVTLTGAEPDFVA